MEMLISMKSDSFFWVIVVITYALRIIGLAPFTVQTEISSKNCRKIFSVTLQFSRIGQAYNAILLVLLIVMTVLEFPSVYNKEYLNKSPLTQTSDIMQIIICGTTTYIVIINWILRQKYAVRMLNRLLEIDRLLYGTENRPIGTRILISFSIHVIFNACLWTVFSITEQIEYSGSLLTWFPINIPSFVIYWFIVEYFIIVGLLLRKFKSVNKNLLKLKEFPNYLSSRTPFLNNHTTVLSLSTHSRLVALRLLDKIRTMLSELSQDVADFFSLPILFCIGNLFFALVYNCYYIVTPVLGINNVFSLMSFSNTISWILISIYPLLNLCFNVTRVVREAKMTGWIVHELLVTTTRKEIKAELNQLSLQLLHENLSFTAFGFFMLDSTLIYSILGATATYLIIFIQFLHLN